MKIKYKGPTYRYLEELEKEDLKDPDKLSGSEIRQLAEKGKEEEWKDKVPDFTYKALEEMNIDLGNRIKALRKIEKKINKYQLPSLVD